MKLLTIAICLMLFGCSKYTQTKALEDVNKANDKYPSPVADWLRGKYPCITKSSDTAFITKDSVVYVECPDLPSVITMPGETDTFTNTIIKTIRVPVTLPVRTQVITKYIEDSAKIKVMTEEIGQLKIQLSKLKADYDELKEKRNWWRKWCLITWGVIVLYFGLRLAIPKIPFLNR